MLLLQLYLFACLAFEHFQACDFALQQQSAKQSEAVLALTACSGGLCISHSMIMCMWNTVSLQMVFSYMPLPNYTSCGTFSQQMTI